MEESSGRSPITDRARDPSVTEDEPPDEVEAFGFPDEDESAAPPEDGWLAAIGQMFAALLVVVVLVALFIAAAVAFRRLFP
jgi:hypothetical protein